MTLKPNVNAILSKIYEHLFKSVVLKCLLFTASLFFNLAEKCVGKSYDDTYFHLVRFFVWILYLLYMYICKRY